MHGAREACPAVRARREPAREGAPPSCGRRGRDVWRKVRRGWSSRRTGRSGRGRSAAHRGARRSCPSRAARRGARRSCASRAARGVPQARWTCGAPSGPPSWGPARRAEAPAPQATARASPSDRACVLFFWGLKVTWSLLTRAHPPTLRLAVFLALATAPPTRTRRPAQRTVWCSKV